MADNERLEFLASLPDTQGAWKRHGGGKGARVTLEIPETQIPGAILLQMLTEKVLKVTIEVVGDPCHVETPM